MGYTTYQLLQEFLHQQYRPSIYFKPGHARKVLHARKRSEPQKEFDDSAVMLSSSSFCGSLFAFAHSTRGAGGTGGATGSSGNLSGVKDGELRNRGVVGRFFSRPTSTKIHKGKSLKKICHTIFKHSFTSLQNMDN